MPIQNGIYYQSQIGGLCRLHSLNAFFGEEKISQSEFNNFQKQYDILNKKMFNIPTSCKSFDIVSSNQKNIVSYILKHYGIYTRYYAINQLQKTNPTEQSLDLKGSFIFVYNESHIYGARKKGMWYTVNSMSGVRKTNINSLLRTKNLGFIIPVDIEREYSKNINLIKSSLNIDEISEEKIEAFLVKQHKLKEILGNMEIPLGICVDILDMKLCQKLENNSKKHVIEKYGRLYDIVKVYNHFIALFTNGRYNDIELIKEYLSIIIFGILNL